MMNSSRFTGYRPLREAQETDDDSSHMFLEKNQVEPIRESNYKSLARCSAHSLKSTGFAIVFVLLLVVAAPEFLVWLISEIRPSALNRPYNEFPYASKIQWEVLPPDLQYWSEDIYMGKPSQESDIAWNELIKHHGFRLSEAEAKRFNLTESLRLTTGEYSSILGVDHNLHCLRHIRQWYYFDYYYGNKSHDEVAWLDEHTVHCLENLRKSIMCFPDLSIYPYYENNHRYHPVNVGTWNRRECVNKDLLWDAISERRYTLAEWEPRIANKIKSAVGTGENLSEDAANKNTRV